jgi:hypothetical protein
MVLESDSTKRKDMIALGLGEIEMAQGLKEDMENEQRHDVKLRGHH